MDSLRRGANYRVRKLRVGDRVKWAGRDSWVTIVDTSGGMARALGPQDGAYTLFDMPDDPGPDIHIEPNVTRTNEISVRHPEDESEVQEAYSRHRQWQREQEG